MGMRKMEEMVKNYEPPIISEPPKPAIPSMQSPKSQSKHIVDELEEFVNKLEKGLLQKATQQWTDLSIRLTLSCIRKEIGSWTPIQKVKCFYFLLKLKSFGFAIDSLISDYTDLPSGAEAFEWWKKAKELQGIKIK